MKMLNLKIIAALATIFSLTAMPNVMAHEGKHDEMQEAKEMKKSGNVSDTLKEIKDHENHLQTLIQNGELEKVHETAFMIRNLAKVVQEKSEGLSPVDHNKVRYTVDEISKVAKRLNRYGDVDDKAKTLEEFGRLQTLIQTLEAQFPK